MTKALIFDTGPIITLALNNLIWLLPRLKQRYGGRFLIPAAVKKELIDRPLTTKKFKLEAFQLLPLIEQGVFEVVESARTHDLTQQLLSMMNTIYYAQDTPIKIVHEGEIDAIATVMLEQGQGLVVDERNTRYILETPSKLKRRLERKLHMHVRVDTKTLRKVREKIGHMHTIRTIELLTIAFECGEFEHYLSKRVPNAKIELLEGLLWGAKLKGSAVQEQEIQEIVTIQKRRLR